MQEWVCNQHYTHHAQHWYRETTSALSTSKLLVRFTQLLLLLLFSHAPLLPCRFIACYAQEVNTPVFWGTWCALVLMYWEVSISSVKYVQLALHTVHQ